MQFIDRSAVFIEFEIQKIKEGNIDAFTRLFEFLYPRLMGWACRFVDDDAAKDPVQDVFADYWGKNKIQMWQTYFQIFTNPFRINV